MHISGVLPAALSSSIVFWKEAKLAELSSEGETNLGGGTYLEKVCYRL
jgi:hypothetical protein